MPESGELKRTATVLCHCCDFVQINEGLVLASSDKNEIRKIALESVHNTRTQFWICELLVPTGPQGVFTVGRDASVNSEPWIYRYSCSCPVCSVFTLLRNPAGFMPLAVTVKPPTVFWTSGVRGEGGWEEPLSLSMAMSSGLTWPAAEIRASQEAFPSASSPWPFCRVSV